MYSIKDLQHINEQLRHMVWYIKLLEGGNAALWAERGHKAWVLYCTIFLYMELNLH